MELNEKNKKRVFRIDEIISVNDLNDLNEEIKFPLTLWIDMKSGSFSFDEDEQHKRIFIPQSLNELEWFLDARRICTGCVSQFNCWEPCETFE